MSTKSLPAYSVLPTKPQAGRVQVNMPVFILVQIPKSMTPLVQNTAML